MIGIRIAVAVATLCVASIAHAKIHKFDVAGISIDVPNKWKINPDGATLTVSSADDTAVVSIGFADNAGLDVTYDLLRDQVASLLTAPTQTDRKPGSIGKLKGWASTAKGKLAGAAVEVLVLAVNLSNTRVVFVLSIGQKGKYEKHQQDLQKCIFSLVPIGGTAAPTPTPTPTPAPVPAGKSASGDYDPSALGKIPEDGRQVAIDFARGVANWDDPKTDYADAPQLLVNLIPKQGVLVGKKRIAAIKMTDEIAQESPDSWAESYFGWTKDSGPWHVASKSKTVFHIYRGSGYGKTSVAVITKAKTWQLTEIKTVDFGAP